MRFERSVLAGVLAASLAWVIPGVAGAQQDVQVAGTAFGEGQQAQLRGDYVRAAELFEIADQAVPSPAALRSAIRNRDAAGQSARAATLALRAVERYPEDRETRAIADEVLAKLTPKLGRVRLRCSEPCTATADGGLLSNEAVRSVELFVAPGPHTFRAAWSGREPAVQSAEVAPGQTIELAFQAPAAPPPAAAAAPPPATPDLSTGPAPGGPASDSSAAASASPSGGGLPPTVFWVGVGLTAIATGATVWSGLDTLSARDDYEDEPTQSGYDDGVKLERRTNILIGVSTLFGLATAGIGLFATDWSGGNHVELEAGASSARLSISGTLP